MTYNDILEKFSFDNVLKMHSFIPYVHKKKVTAYPNLLLESEGMISNSDRKLQAVVLRTAEIILNYFADKVFNSEILTPEDLYDATIYGLFNRPKQCKHFVLKVNNEWIDNVDVYFAIEGGAEDDSHILGDNSTMIILIDPDNSGQRINPLKYNVDKTRLEYGSIFIKNVTIYDSCAANGITSLDMIPDENKSSILKDILGTIMHEIAHLYYMWRNGVQQKDIVYDLTAFNNQYPTVYQNVSFQSRNIQSIIQSLNNKFSLDFAVKSLTVDEIAHFFKIDDLFGFIYMLNKSELTSRLENFKKEISYDILKKIIQDYNMNKMNKKHYTLEETIVRNSIEYQRYMMLAKILNSMRDNVENHTKKKFIEKYGEVLSDIYKIHNDDNLFDNVINLFLDRCHYFMHNAGSYISRRIDTYMSYKKNKARILKKK